MLTSDNKWNISFAGCGFLGIYYFGVYSCLLERAHHLIKSTSKICGASSGALIAAMIACEMSPAKCCENLMAIAKEARKGMLSSMHPSFNLLKLTRQLMVRELPDNAHLLASGKLCVSLTRLSDGKNVLVSEFTSKDDLIQALFCSCFFPLYCGVVPPSYHGTRYVDGALSDSAPYSTLKNTITVSPFSGESDICPYDNPVYCQEVRHCNMSININLANVHRVIQAFFPPEPEVMAEICHNGYKDALMFLKQNDLLEQDSFMTELIINHRQDKRPWFNTHNYTWQDDHREPRRSGSMSGQSCVLDKQEMNLLPVSIQKGRCPRVVYCQNEKLSVESLSENMAWVCPSVFCDAGTKKHRWMSELFAVKLVTSILMVCVLPVEIVYFMLLRFAGWMLDMVSDLL
ncbi:patatin-like phospholipase domain-containing protein 2 isoform X1 [Pangasianodon hypophthalmus]|uniref:patatin-like phospholipase domain-containing protein 2 isoform X1 n=1 Tax=Pangasianodon hypophthalmus TaxID=310915 RepID=UPI0023073715|nr:patatin-like phospholipase domain-containing protein 2 isoform X1 [Pangasianodon hypophthalmus]